MKKQNVFIVFIVFTLFSLTFVSASSVNYMPINQPDTTSWMEWQIISSTDNLIVEFSDKYSKTSDIWLVDTAKQLIETYDTKTARFVTTLDTSNVVITVNKNVYTSALATTPSKILLVSSKVDYAWSDELKATQRITKYGYNIKGNGDKYLKIGEATTVIGYVNQTGGAGYKGYNICQGLVPCLPTGVQLSTAYTTAEKNIVSVDNSTVVSGVAGGLGGLDCVGKGGNNPSCTTYTSQGNCINYIQFSPTVANSCMWIGSCVSSQPCTTYTIHQLVFNITKAGATNLTFVSKSTSDNQGNPSQIVNFSYYLTNTSNAYVLIGSCLMNPISVSVPCNFTYSTTNINNFVSSSGLVTLTVQTDNVNQMKMRYAELKIDYRDVVVRYNTLAGLIQALRYRSPNQNLIVRWRTS